MTNLMTAPGAAFVISGRFQFNLRGSVNENRDPCAYMFIAIGRFASSGLHLVSRRSAPQVIDGVIDNSFRLTFGDLKSLRNFAR